MLCVFIMHRCYTLYTTYYIHHTWNKHNSVKKTCGILTPHSNCSVEREAVLLLPPNSVCGKKLQAVIVVATKLCVWQKACKLSWLLPPNFVCGYSLLSSSRKASSALWVPGRFRSQCTNLGSFSELSSRITTHQAWPRWTPRNILDDGHIASKCRGRGCCAKDPT